MRPSGPLLAALGVFVLCMMDAAIKAASSGHGTATIAAARYAFGAIPALAAYLLWSRSRITAAQWRVHAVRGAVIAVAGSSFFHAIALLPLAEAITLGFVAPLLIPFTARAMLGERLRAPALIAAGIGFAGVLVTALGSDAGNGGVPGRRLEGVASVLVSAVAYAVSMVMLRGRAMQDSPLVISLLAALVPAALLLPAAAILAPVPEPGALPLLALIGLLGTAGMYLLTLAYGRAQAQSLAPLEYTALGWGALTGWIGWQEPLRPAVLAGAAIIAGACLYAAWDERRARMAA